jgi:uncharacterized protein YbgA (DUF1722 family)
MALEAKYDRHDKRFKLRLMAASTEMIKILVQQAADVFQWIDLDASIERSNSP